MNVIRMASRLAWRDLRGGLGSLWVVVIQVSMAVAMMAAIGSLAEAALSGMAAAGRQAVGGDLSLRLFHAPATPAQMATLDSLGRVGTVAELRPLAVASGGRTLVELKAVDAAYPLYGTAEVSGAADLHAALGRTKGTWGAVVAPALLDRLDIGLGDRLRLGDLEVAVRGILQSEPDRAFRAFSLAPRVVINQQALAETGLTPPGASVYWYYRLRLNQPAATALATLEARHPDAGWRIVDGSDGIPGVERSVDLARALFLLTALAVLLVGGLGIGNAVRAHVTRRLPTLATLKALGARPRLILGMVLLQVLAAAVLGSLLGGALGAGLAAVALPLAPDWMAGPWQPGALLLAAAVAVLATLAFASGPLATAATARTSKRARMVGGALALVMAAVVVAWTGMPGTTAAFLSGCAVAAGLFAGLGRTIAWGARRLAPRYRAVPRLALANLARPGAPTVAVAIVLGLALALGVMVAMVGQAAMTHVEGTLPADSPAALILSLPPGEDAGHLVAVPGVHRVKTAPFLHARISRLNGRLLRDADVPRSVAWAVRGDRGLSWRAAPPPEGTIVAGAWWAADHTGPQLASVDATVAAKLGLGIGDSLTLATPAGPLTAQVANLRRLDWTRLDLDFPILLSPPAEPPPHTRVAALWAEPEALPAIEAALPEAPILRTAPLLDALAAAVAQVRRLLTGISTLTLAAAGLVLVAAITGSARLRRREATILRALGAGRRSLRRMVMLEFALLGAAIAGIAVPLGTVAGLALTAAITEAGAAPSLAIPATAFAATLAVMAVAGGLLAGRLGRASPAAELRAE